MSTRLIGGDTIHIEIESKAGKYTSMAQYNNTSTTIALNCISLVEAQQLQQAVNEYIGKLTNEKATP